MGSLNRCEFIGNLGRDPETRYMTSGDPVTNFSIACNETWKGKDGEEQKRVEWVSLVAFGKLAEICGEYLKVGRQVYVAGRMQTRKWQDKEGADRYTTEVVIDKMVMLGGKDGGEGEESAPSRGGSSKPAQSKQPASDKNKNPTADDLDDEIPF